MKTKESKAATYLCIGIVLSFALTIFKTLILDRYPFYNIAVSFGMTLVIGIVIGLVVPFDLIFASECRRHNFNSSSFPTKMLFSLIADAIFTPLMTIPMVFFNYLIPNKEVASQGNLILDLIIGVFAGCAVAYPFILLLILIFSKIGNKKIPDAKNFTSKAMK